MFRTGIIAAVAMLLIAAAPIPSPKPADQGRPPVAQHQTADAQHSNYTNDASEEGKTSVALPGSRTDAPLYVHANCEHGCGYAEHQESWWQKFLTDPNATFALAVAFFTFGLLGAGVWQGSLILRQIKLARAEFDATHRPWVSVKAAIGPSGLFYNVNGINIELAFACKNTGGSPALNVAIVGEAEFAVFSFGLIGRLDSICKRVASGKLGAPGTTIFPGDTVPLGMCWSEGKGWQEKTEIPAAKHLCQPIIIGAVVYQFPFGDRKFHFTRFVYHVSKLKDGVGGFFIDVNEGDQKATALRLDPWFDGIAFEAD